MFETVSPTLHVANSFMRCNLASNRHQLLAFEWKKSGVGMIPRSKPWNQVFWGASSRCRSSTWTIAWEHGRRMEMIIFGTLEDTCTMYNWQHFECMIVDIYGFGTWGAHPLITRASSSPFNYIHYLKVLIEEMLLLGQVFTISLWTVLSSVLFEVFSLFSGASF